MKTYYLGNIHKITVAESAGMYEVRFFELTGSRWVQLGASECWGSLEDIKAEYGII